ncbi:MAG TPA: GNAT family N-acetyltransferase [Actinomycetota bacterium]
MGRAADAGSSASVSVRLRPMTRAEFADWSPWAIEDYAREIAEEQHVHPERALQLMRRFLAERLPEGAETAGHRLRIAEADGVGRVGYLWFGPKETDAGVVCWLYDLWVDEPHRARGYGRAMMHALQDEARAAGFSRIELNVFARNHRAQALYASLGFVEMTRQYYLEL